MVYLPFIKTRGRQILLCLLFVGCTAGKKEDTGRITFEINSAALIDSLARPGDIIMKNGYGNISRMITSVLDEEHAISHCGILDVDDSTGAFYIIHSVAKQVSDRDGVQRIGLKRFINDVKPGDLYLLRYKDHAKASAIVKEARCLLAAEVPFDHSYDLTSDDALYCSEFVYKVVLNSCMSETFKIRKLNNTDLLYFNGILNNKNFEILLK